MGFEDFMAPEKDRSAIDVLNEMNNEEKINFHTEFGSMKQIRVLNKIEYMAMRYPNNPVIQRLNGIMQSYKELKTSYKRRRSGEMIEGIKEAKEMYLQEALMNKQKEG